MNLMDAIMSANASPLSQISKKFGLSEDQTAQVVKQFLPALTNGIKQNVARQGGLDSLLDALNKGKHERYLDDEAALGSDQAILDGNGILGHLLKSKDTSRQLASRTAQSTGLDLDILKKILPMVAGLAMGALKKQGSSSGVLPKTVKGKKAAAPSSMGGLISLLDADGDGSPIDDLLGFAKKLF